MDSTIFFLRQRKNSKRRDNKELLLSNYPRNGRSSRRNAAFGVEWKRRRVYVYTSAVRPPSRPREREREGYPGWTQAPRTSLRTSRVTKPVVVSPLADQPASQPSRRFLPSNPPLASIVVVQLSRSRSCHALYNNPRGEGENGIRSDIIENARVLREIRGKDDCKFGRRIECIKRTKLCCTV